MDLQFNKNEDTNKLRLSEINQLYAKIKKGGGEKALQKQHEQGKLTARERIAYLLDNDDEAIEIAAFAGHEMYDEHGGCPIFSRMVNESVFKSSLKSKAS